VKDHKDSVALVADVLLYDRLLLPYPEDEKERTYWAGKERDWDPDLMDERLAALGELAEAVPWNEWKRGRFHEELSALRARDMLEDVKRDVKDMHDEVERALPYQITRRILKQGAGRTSSSGVEPVVVAAYRSWADIRADYLLDPVVATSSEAELALLVGRRFALPTGDQDCEGVLRDAIALAKEDEFRKKRRALFDWEDAVFSGRLPLKPEEALEELTAKSEEYNQQVARAGRKVWYKFAFTIGGAALGTAGFLITGNPLSLGSATLSLIQFATLDRKPVIQAGTSAPAAMLHDIHKLLRQ
jgi:hypothetical protein